MWIAYLLKIGANFFTNGSQDICKDTESNLAPFTSKGKLFQSKLYFRFRAELCALNN